MLDSRNIVDSETARLVSEIERIGQKQYADFVQKPFCRETVLISLFSYF